MQTIILTQGQYAIIDDTDYDKMSKYKWYALRAHNRYWKAVRNIRKSNGKTSIILMSRYIMGAIKGEVIDHINGDTLDNRRDNLRICTQSENMQNIHTNQGVSSYQGVYWHNQRKWRSQIGKNGRKYHLGLFDTKEEAAVAYNQAALEFYNKPKLNKIKINRSIA